MMYKANVAVCSDIRTKHSTQSESHVEFLNVKPWWYVKKPLGVKRLICCRYTIIVSGYELFNQRIVVRLPGGAKDPFFSLQNVKPTPGPIQPLI